MAAATLASFALTPAHAATIKVTTVTDELNADGDCSLREAVQSANDNSSVDDCAKGQGGGKIDTVRLKVGDYDLTIPTTNEDQNADGDLDYTGGGKLALVGKGADLSSTLLSSAGADDRVLDAVGDASGLTASDLFVLGGDVSGLGSLQDGGGGVRVSEGSLTMSRVTVRSGRARLGGGIAFTSTDAPLRLTRVTLDNNEVQSTPSVGGGPYAAFGGKATIRRSLIEDNDAASGAARGGGIYSFMDSMVITDTTFDDNDAEGLGASGEAEGGAIISGPKGLEVRRSLFTQNDVTEDEEGVDAGAGAVQTAYNDGFFPGSAKIVNSTFYENSTADSGGAFQGRGTLSHVTFLSNEADANGDHIEATGKLTLRNSMLPGLEGFIDLCSTSLDGEVVSKGFGLSGYDDPTCAFLDSDVVGAPEFVPGGTADNGGATETVAIDSTSPARDLVPKGKCKVAQGTDQRGFKRPKGKKCDSGAFERGAKP